jgi:hypothetical protein
MKKKKETSPSEAVNNCMSLYDRIPNSEDKARYLKAIAALSRQSPTLYRQVFSSDSEVTTATESQNILDVLKKKLDSLENNK